MSTALCSPFFVARMNCVCMLGQPSIVAPVTFLSFVGFHSFNYVMVFSTLFKMHGLLSPPLHACPFLLCAFFIVHVIFPAPLAFLSLCYVRFYELSFVIFHTVFVRSSITHLDYTSSGPYAFFRVANSFSNFLSFLCHTIFCC